MYQTVKDQILIIFNINVKIIAEGITGPEIGMVKKLFKNTFTCPFVDPIYMIVVLCEIGQNKISFLVARVCARALHATCKELHVKTFPKITLFEVRVPGTDRFLNTHYSFDIP